MVAAVDVYESDCISSEQHYCSECRFFGWYYTAARVSSLQYCLFIEEDWKWLNLVEDPVRHRNHNKLLLHSRKWQ